MPSSRVPSTAPRTKQRPSRAALSLQPPLDTAAALSMCAAPAVDPTDRLSSIAGRLDLAFPGYTPGRRGDPTGRVLTLPVTGSTWRHLITAVAVVATGLALAPGTWAGTPATPIPEGPE